MPRIERYTRGIIKPRAVADTVNPRAISDAVAPYAGAAEASGFVADKLDKFVQAQEATAVNEAIIKNKKQKMEFLDAKRKENMLNPTEFAKRIEPELKKIDDEMAQNLPTGRAKSAFQERMQQINLSAYENNFQWERTRQVEIMADRIEVATKNSADMSYLAGQSGALIDDIIKDAQATVVAAGTFLSPEAQRKSSQAIMESVYGSYLKGVGEKNPYEAIALLNDDKYISALGADAAAGQKVFYQNKIMQAKKEADEAKIVEQLVSPEDPSILPDPFNSKHRKMLDKAYSQSGLAEALARGDPIAVNETVDIFRNTKIIPESAQSVLRGFAFNGTQEEKATAYTIIGKMQDVDPVMLEAAGGFSKSEIADAKIYNDFIRSGASPDYALQAIQRSNDPIESSTRERREKEFKEIDPEKTLIKYRDKFIGQADKDPWWDVTSWFSADADFLGAQNQEAILRNYSTILEEEYLRTGNKDAAASAAAFIVSRHAGVSYIGGKKSIMMHPPENYYSVPGLSREENSEWMRKQIEANVADLGINHKDSYLVPSHDSGYRVDNGIKPVYFVWHEDPKTKVNDYVRGEDNMPVVMDFDQEAGAVFAAKKIIEKRRLAKAQSVFESGNKGMFLNTLPTLNEAIKIQKSVDDVWKFEAQLKSGQSVLDLAKEIDMAVSEDAN